MWKSEDDVLKDIASLNDFGNPDDKESYKILYSIGRGLKAKEKQKTPQKFIDSRTGEAINLEDPSLDNSQLFCKSKGRGSLVGSLFRTNLQLQQQLRLARPLGSGDQAIESYYGKGRSQDNVNDSISLPDCKFPDTKITLENHTDDPKSSKTSKRVIATRNSSSQVNALITNLLSKHKEGTDFMKEDFKNEQERKNSIFSDSEQCSTQGKIDIMQNSASSDSDFSDSTLFNNCNSKAFEKNVNHRQEGKSELINKKYIGDKNFIIIDDDESEEEEEQEQVAVEREKKDKQEMYVKKTNTSNDFFETLWKVKNNVESLDLSDNDRDIKYKALGEKMNRLRKNKWNTIENGSCDSVPYFEFTAPKEKMILSDEDFPPLPKH